MLRTLASLVLAVCAGAGALAFYNFAVLAATGGSFSSATIVLFFVGGAAVSGLAAGGVLGRFLNSQIPVWWAFRFGVVVGVIWFGFGVGSPAGDPFELVHVVTYQVAPATAFVIACVLGATWSKRRGASTRSIDA